MAASTGRFQVCLQRALVGGSVGWRGVQAMPHLRVDVGFGTHSIAAYAEAMQVPNMLPPILLDVSQGWETWGGHPTRHPRPPRQHQHDAHRGAALYRGELRRPSPRPCPLVWGSQG